MYVCVCMFVCTVEVTDIWHLGQGKIYGEISKCVTLVLIGNMYTDPPFLLRMCVVQPEGQWDQSWDKQGERQQSRDEAAEGPIQALPHVDGVFCCWAVPGTDANHTEMWVWHRR